jgi:C-terminal processing protease CtpA/Prc
MPIHSRRYVVVPAILFASLVAASAAVAQGTGPRTGCTGLEIASRADGARRLHPRISAVEAGSPAERAGFKRGDVILSVSGQDSRDAAELFVAPAGTHFRVVIRRDAAERQVELTLGWRLMVLQANADPAAPPTAACRPLLPGA